MHLHRITSLFVIPIYYCNEASFYDKREKAFEKKAENFSSESGISKELALMKIEEHPEWHGISFHPWRYNEVIAVIEIYLEFGMVMFNTFYTKEKKHYITSSKKPLFFNNMLGGHHFNYVEFKTNEMLLAEIEHWLSMVVKDYKKHYVDLRQFNSIKKHIDLLAIIKEHDQRLAKNE